MRHRASPIAAAACFSMLVASALGGCAVAAPQGRASPTAMVSASAAPSATFQPSHTRTPPASGATPSAGGTPQPAPSATEGGGPTPSARATAEPPMLPVAELHGPFEPVAGMAVRSCVAGECTDTGPLDPRELPRAAAGLGGSGLSIELPRGTPISSWGVVAEGGSPGQGPQTVPLGSGGREPYAALYVNAPEQGEWILRARLHWGAEDFADYYWSLRVREPSRPPVTGVGPPDGTLEGGGRSMTALEGSYCLGETCSDIGRLPTARISPLLRVGGPDRELRFDLASGSEFATWAVSYWGARDDAGSDITDLAAGGEARSSQRQAAFLSPPPGDWQLKIRLGFGGGGDATYYIHLVVLP